MRCKVSLGARLRVSLKECQLFNWSSLYCHAQTFFRLVKVKVSNDLTGIEIQAPVQVTRPSPVGSFCLNNCGGDCQDFSLKNHWQVQFKKRLKIALLISISSRVALPQQGNAYLDLHYIIKMVRVSCVNS